MLLLAGDVGGTKTALALVQDGALIERRTYPSAAFESLEAMVGEFVGDRSRDDRPGLLRHRRAGHRGHGAGPRTCAGWSRRGRSSVRFGFPRVGLVNDFRGPGRGDPESAGVRLRDRERRALGSLGPVGDDRRRHRAGRGDRHPDRGRLRGDRLRRRPRGLRPAQRAGDRPPAVPAEATRRASPTSASWPGADWWRSTSSCGTARPSSSPPRCATRWRPAATSPRSSRAMRWPATTRSAIRRCRCSSPSTAPKRETSRSRSSHAAASSSPEGSPRRSCRGCCDGTFRASFVAKGRLSPMLEAMPVKVVRNPDAGLLGAASLAAKLPL